MASTPTPATLTTDVLELAGERLTNLEERVRWLESIVSTVRVELHPSRKVAAHSCWSGSLAEYSVLQPFMCHGCQQLVSRSFSAVLVAYTEDANSQQRVRTTIPESPERSGT